MTETNSNSYSFYVKRDTYKTVTGFALLVPASESEATGEANFLPSIRKQFVRIVSLDDIRKAARGLRGVEALHFDACLYLKAAMKGDLLAFTKALDRFTSVFQAREKEAHDHDVRSGWQIHPDGKKTKHLPGGVVVTQLPVDPAKYEVNRALDSEVIAKFLVNLFSNEITTAIFDEYDLFAMNGKKPQNKPPRIVCWYYDGDFRPAIYCPDLKAALYIHTFLLAPAGGIGFRACPYDGEQFFQDRPNQEYCCPAHREAHRVARFREKKKRVAAEQGKKGRKHGTKKAR